MTSPQPPQDTSSQPPTPSTKEGSASPEDKDGDSHSYARSLGWLLLTVIVAWGGLQMPLPYRILAPAAGVVGLVLAIMLFVQCIRRKLPAMVYFSAVITFACSVMFALLGGFQVAFWEATAEFDNCQDSAVTDRALNQCATDYEERILSGIPGFG